MAKVRTLIAFLIFCLSTTAYGGESATIRLPLKEAVDAAEEALNTETQQVDAGQLVSQLNGYHSQKVAVRGFLHQTPQGAWSLAPQASLESCCIGRRCKAAMQVMLDRKFTEKHKGTVVTVEGRFLVDPKWAEDGELTQVFRLTGTRMRTNEKKRFPYLTVGAFIVVAGAAFTTIARKRRKP